jgi:hypothetical protein
VGPARKVMNPVVQLVQDSFDIALPEQVDFADVQVGKDASSVVKRCVLCRRGTSIPINCQIRVRIWG